MTKNKVFKWVDQVKGLCRAMPRDMTIGDTARMMANGFWKTCNQNLKQALPTVKTPFEMPKGDATKVSGLKSNDAKNVGLEAIRELKMPSTLSKKKIQTISPWSIDGLISKTLYIRKMFFK